MFCYQCEQAAKGTGCEKIGVCGKQPDTASLQDLILYQLKGIGFLAYQAQIAGKNDDEVNKFIVEALFSTVTNVNFDNDRLVQILFNGDRIADKLVAMNSANRVQETWPESTKFRAAQVTGDLVTEGNKYDLRLSIENEDIRSLQHLLIFGLKGLAAYTYHAYQLGKTKEEIFFFFHEALATLNHSSLTIDELVALNMKCGEINIITMELLDEAHTSRYGHPQPTEVQTGLQAGPAIVVSGHDLLDLEELLKQTEGSGVSIYTHGEMLPAHGYPELKKYKHLVGHFGTAWQNQQKEFKDLPVAFLFTTNCIQKPLESYINQVFTTGLVGWPQVQHIDKTDFSALIEKAQVLGGLSENRTGTSLTTGFARNAVLGVADKVIAAVKAGAIKRFFLVGGCDGSKPSRNYYTELVEKTPHDSIILTLACGKFKFNHLELGTVEGLPRLLDIGQCNDAYSAVKIALALADAFSCGVNDLPLSIILSWYEQKAVVILLSLLHLGIKGIRIGPSLPAFITPAILNFLVENFAVKPITNAEEDLAEILK